MNRRGFVKALAVLPAVVGGLNIIPNAASPDCVAHPADAVGTLVVDPFDDWLDFVGEGRYASGPVKPVEFRVGVDLAGKDGRDMTVYLDSAEIDFHREAVVGRISEPKLLTGGPTAEVEISMKLDGGDRMSEMMTLWAAEAEEAARRCRESIESMVFRSIVPDDRHQRVLLERVAKAADLPVEVLTGGLRRTSKPARLA